MHGLQSISRKLWTRLCNGKKYAHRETTTPESVLTRSQVSSSTGSSRIRPVDTEKPVDAPTPPGPPPVMRADAAVQAGTPSALPHLPTIPDEIQSSTGAVASSSYLRPSTASHEEDDELSKFPPLFHFGNRTYTTKRLLGSGSYGSVLLTQEGDTDRVFAIKTIRKGGCMLDCFRLGDDVGDDNFAWLASVREEAKALRLCHKSKSFFLPKGTMYYQDLEFFCFVMTAHPITLGERIHQCVSNGLTLESRFLYTCELASAVQALHAMDLFHLDLKPHNIMIQANGHLCLIDFGLASTERRLPRYHMGTPGYNAPEVRQSDVGHFDCELADVYSFGQVMLDMYICPQKRSDSQETVDVVMGLTWRIRDLIIATMQDAEIRPTMLELMLFRAFDQTKWEQVRRGQYEVGFVPPPLSL